MKYLRLPVALLLLNLTSCLHTRTTSQAYEATEPAPSVGGARFRAEFIPRGSEAAMTVSAMVVGGAMITENGPYQMRLHAFGKPSDQRWFRVTRFVLSVPGRLNAPMEKRGFEGLTEFKPTQSPGSTRASLLLGTHIHINEQHPDKEVVVEADVELMRRSGLTRGTIRIPMKQSKTKRSENYMLPVEIVKSIRQKEKIEDITPALPPAPEMP